MGGNSGDSQASAWGRAVVIAYAAGIVALGIYPLEHRHGGTFHYLKTQSSKLLQRNWVPESWKKGNKIEIESVEKKSDTSIVSNPAPPEENTTEAVVFGSRGPNEPKKESASERREALKELFGSIAK